MSITLESPIFFAVAAGLPTPFSLTNDFYNLSFVWLLSLYVGKKADLLTLDSISFFPYSEAFYEKSCLQFKKWEGAKRCVSGTCRMCLFLLQYNTDIQIIYARNHKIVRCLSAWSQQSPWLRVCVFVFTVHCWKFLSRIQITPLSTIEALSCSLMQAWCNHSDSKSLSFWEVVTQYCTILIACKIMWSLILMASSRRGTPRKKMK